MKSAITKGTIAPIALLALMASFGVSGAANAAVVDPRVAEQVSLQVCMSEQDLDCISFFGTVDEETQIATAAEYVGFEALGEYRDDQRNLIKRGEAKWRVAGLAEPYGVDARLESPMNLSFYGFRSGALRINVNGNEQDLNTKILFKVRTSWLEPLNSNLYAADAAMTFKKIRGGYEWTFTGKRNLVFEYNHDQNREAKIRANAPADFSRTDFKFIVDHYSANGNSFYDGRCASKGFPATATNAPWGGMPYWNFEKKSLDFNIGSPHLDLNGNLINGYFSLSVQKSFIECAWPGLNTANGLTVSVLNTDGSRQIATTVARLENGVFKMRASNFHYSSPTIRIEAKKRTINCVSKTNPKIVRKVVAVKPTCSMGFVRK